MHILKPRECIDHQLRQGLDRNTLSYPDRNILIVLHT